MKLYIVGAGAIGMLLAAKLQTVSSSLLLVCRTLEQSEAIRQEGIWLEDQNGGRHVPVTTVTYEDVERMERTDVADVIFLCVKQHQLHDRLIQSLRYISDDKTLLVSFQNGLGHLEWLQEKLVCYLGAAVTTEASTKHGRSYVHHTGRGETVLGSWPEQAQAHPMFSHVISLMEKAGFDAKMSNNIRVNLWRKLAVNGIINPLTALLRIQNGLLGQDDDLERVMRQVYSEIKQVAELEGITSEFPQWTEIIAVIRSSANNYSSMLQDVMQHRKTELDWITGFILQKGKSHQLELPVNELIYRLVKGLENVQKLTLDKP